MSGMPTKNQYDEANFYISATDKWHNKTTVRQGDKTLTVPPYLAAMVSHFVESDLTPYRNAADVIRDALVHQIFKLTRYEKQPPKNWEMFKHRAELEKAAAEAEIHRGVVERTQSVFTIAHEQRDPVLVKEAIDAAQRMVPTLRSPYKEQLEDLITAQQRTYQFPSP